LRTWTFGTERITWAPEGAADNNGDPKPDANGDPKPDANGDPKPDNGPAFDPEKTFANLDADTRGWLQKGNLDKDPAALAKKAFEQEKLIGGSIRVPGKDATKEELDAFYGKLGRPDKADAYEFAVPKDLPKDLPYDGNLATSFKQKAFELGLNPTQAAAIHDMFVGYQVDTFGKLSGDAAAKTQERATKAAAELVKLWGPLDGPTAQANLEIADQVFTKAPGGQELLADLKAIGLVGPNKEILSPSIAKFLAGIGTALYTEDGVLRGRPDEVDNPFADGASFNATKQMQIYKADPDRARSLIAAAGKKPADFGLQG